MLAVLTIPLTDFELPTEVVVLGTIAGLTYAVLGMGLTLTYKSSRVLNFAHGELGALPAIIIPVLVINHGWSYWGALPLALAASAMGGALMEFVVIRKLARSSRLIVLVATIGVSQLFFAIGALIPKEGRLGSAVFPTPFDASITIGNLRLGSGQLLILAVVPVVTVALALFLQRSRLGMASRAAAENVDAAQLAGVPVRRVSLTIWILAGVLAGIAAVLLGPTRPIVTRVALGPSLMVRALAAAMIGGLGSMPRVFVGGITIGLVEALVQWNYPTGGTLEVVIFAVVLVSLLARRGLGVAARGGEATSWSLAGTVRNLEARLARQPRVRVARAAFLVALITLAVVVALPMSNAQRVLMSSIALFALMGLSLVVLTGFAGQVSLGQFAFVGLGAIVGGRMHQLGYPPWMAVLYAVLAGGVVALVIGLPALRLRGLFLAVTTLAFAVAAQTWLYGQAWLVRVVGGETSLVIPRPKWLGIDFQKELNYYLLCVAVLVVTSVLVHRLRNTGIGRSMMAVRDNEPVTATLGVSPRRVKLTAFVIAGMIASLAGYFYGGLLVNFTDPSTFAAELSLALVALVILGGVTTITGAVLGALWIRGLGHIFGPLLPDILGDRVALIVGGVGLLIAVLQFPGGIASIAFHVRDRVVGWLTGEKIGKLEVSDRALGAVRPRLAPRAEAVAGNGQAAALAADDIVVRFGGNLAVDHVTISVDRGEIVGLVGPNGAGKTTLFDVLSGMVRPEVGRVLLDGEEITWLRPERRAQLGLGRTFQQARLFDEMRLLDAFKVALERAETSEVVPSLLGLPPSREAEQRKQLKANQLVDLFGLGPFADLHVSELSTGTRRLCELATMVGLGARVLLLDEPTAGIAQREVEAFRPVLREIREHLGATMVVIDHDIPMIMELVDRLYVLNAGQVIAEGPPAAMREDPRVIAAYLGTDERIIARSGSVAAAVAETVAHTGDGKPVKRRGSRRRE